MHLSALSENPADSYAVVMSDINHLRPLFCHLSGLTPYLDIAQNGPPAPAPLLASSKIMDNSHS